MKQILLIAILSLAAFTAGIAVARAKIGWEPIPSPCNVASLAVSASEIAVVCEGDRSTILIKQR